MKLTSEDWLFHSPEGKSKNQNYVCSIACSGLGINLVASLPQEFNIDSNAAYEESMAQMINNTPAGQAIGPFVRAAGVQLTSQAMTAQIWQGTTEMTFNLPLIFQAETDEIEDVANKLAQLISLTLPDELTPNGLLTAPGPTLNIPQFAGSLWEGTKGTLGYVTDFAKGMGVASVGELLEGGGLDSLRKGYEYAGRLASGEWKTSDQSNSSGKGGGQPSPPSVSMVKNSIQLMIGRHMFFESVVVTNASQTHFVQPLESGTLGRVEVVVGFKTFFTQTKKDLANMIPNATWSPNSKNPINKNTRRVPNALSLVPPGMIR